jgi:uncharacterized cupin superfamily protein
MNAVAAAVKAVVNLDELPFDSSSYGDRFAVETGEIGQALGLSGLGAMLHVVPPGKTAFPYHRHHGSDEMFLILSGEGTYRIGDRRLSVKSGDCLGAPAGGEAHQIINTGVQPLRYVGFSNNTSADLVEYPDGGNISVRVGARGVHYVDATFKARGRLTPADYWDGEEDAQ